MESLSSTQIIKSHPAPLSITKKQISKPSPNHPITVKCSATCDADCLCQLLTDDADEKDVLSSLVDQNSEVVSDIDVDEIYQVLGRDVLKSSLLEDIGLYLECDEDNLYSVCPEPSKSSSFSPPKLSSKGSVQFRVVFQLPKPEQQQQRFQCDKCRRSFTRENLLKNHFARDHAVKRLFKCAKCDYVGNLYRHLQRHISRKHLQTSKAKSKKLSVPKKGLLESKTIEPAILEESHCPQMVTDPQTLHVEIVKLTGEISDGDPTLVIPVRKQEINGAKSVTSKKVVTMRKASTKQKTTTYQCDRCSQIFKQRRCFISHMRKHDGLLEHQCSVCEKRFSCGDSLRKHKKTHSDERPLVCAVTGCGKCFKSNSALNEHAKLVHKRKIIACMRENYQKNHLGL